MSDRRELPPALNRLSERIIGCAVEVHRELGPGLLERIYEEAFIHELELAGLRVAQQVPIRLTYKNKRLPDQRIDLIVEDLVIVELKSIEAVMDLHLAQLVSYLHAAHKPLGLIINFNVPVLTKGIRRRIHSSALPSQGVGFIPAQTKNQNSAPSASPLRPLRSPHSFR
jgi:GxxExxY protein